MGLLLGPSIHSKPEKLKIEAFADENFRSAKGSIELQINPESISHDHNITSFSHNESPYSIKGSIANARFSGIESEKLKFDFYLDGTGIVAAKPIIGKGLPGGGLLSSLTDDYTFDVAKAIKDIKNLIYKYQGSIHGPYYLKISWGNLFKADKPFQCRLESFDVDYELFKSDGSPLRAKINCSFKQYLSPKQAEAIANRSSPDLSHVITVREYDTLPVLCQQVYGDPSYYLEVAKINGLRNVHRLTPGQQILFPPIEK